MTGVRVRVPATSANLGPGFDAFGLALALYDDVEVRLSDGGIGVEVRGEGEGEVARDETNLVVRSLRYAADRFGGDLPGLSLQCANRIPHTRGLGSSAAAIVAGVLAAAALTGNDTGADAVGLAAAIEGHPDNVAACLLGGLTVAWRDDGQVRAERLAVAPDLTVYACVPSYTASTHAARAVLPASVPHAEAAANAARAALLVEALGRRPELLLAATEDWLHQRYRAVAMPETAGLVAKLRSRGVPAVVSGAGPTVLAFAEPGELPAGWRRLDLAVDTGGATVTHLEE